MADILIKGGTIVTMDKKRRLIENGVVIIKKGKIVFVGGREEIERRHGAEKEIDARGKVLFPGLINAHTHMFQVLLRGLGPDIPLMDWLKKAVWPMAATLSESDVYTGALLGSIENVKSGATSVIDMHYIKPLDAVAKAMDEVGVRGCLARGYYEKNVPEELCEDPNDALKDCERLIKKWHGAANGRIMIGVAPMDLLSVSKELLVKSKEIAEKYNVIYHTHTSNSMEVKVLEELGILGPRYNAVHCTLVSKGGIKGLARSGCHVIHNPVSNMYLGVGVTLIPEMRNAGINVALGTDGPASNNNQDLIEGMKFAACLHKVNKRNPAIITAQDVLEMATINGAKALGLEREIGSIEVGKKADLIIVDMQKPHIAPVHDPVAALVYCANGGDVDTTIIDGKIVMENRQIKTVDEKEIIQKAVDAAYGLKKRAK